MLPRQEGDCQERRKLLLVDGHSLIHRAYHAFPPTLSTASGELTNAVYGFTRMLLEAIHELNPTHVAVAFDLPGPTFRETMFVGYKRSRVKPDDAMIAQIPRVKEVAQTLGIPIFEVPGFEADDVIGTLCRQATEKTINRPMDKRINRPIDQLSNNPLVHSSIYPLVSVTILTSDRDLMQLVREDRVRVKMPERSKKYGVRSQNLEGDLWDEKRFVEAWGFAPSLLPDYKAFAGDASDDIPGVAGVGEKTAKMLIATFGKVDDVYESLFKQKAESLRPELRSSTPRLRLEEPRGGKRKGSDLNASRPSVMSSGLRLRGRSDSRRSNDFTLHASLLKKLAEDQEAAQMSKKLATIDTDVPIKLDWKSMEVHGYDKERALKLFDELQFKSLIPKLPNDAFEESVQEVLF